MSKRAYIEIGFGLVIVALLAIAGKTWLEEHDARLVLKQELAAQQQVIDSADKRIKERDGQLQQQLSDLEKLRQQKPTIQEIVKQIPIAIPGLPAPIETPLPNAPNVQIPVQDLAAFRDFYISCKEDRVKLDTCNQDAADAIIKINGLENQKNDAVIAIKGGTKWQRFSRNLKWLAIGAGVGAAAGAIAHH